MSFGQIKKRINEIRHKIENVDKINSTLNDIRQHFENGEYFETNREILGMRNMFRGIGGKSSK